MLQQAEPRDRPMYRPSPYFLSIQAMMGIRRQSWTEVFHRAKTKQQKELVNYGFAPGPVTLHRKRLILKDTFRFRR